MLKNAFFLLIPVALIGFSCTKKTLNPISTSTNAMSASVNGASWTANSFSTITSPAFAIVGIRSSDGAQVEVTVPTGTTPGTYSINSLQYFDVTYTPNQSGNATTYFGRSGTIVISSYSNNVMVGTFSASCTDATNTYTATVTNGNFTANF